METTEAVKLIQARLEYYNKMVIFLEDEAFIINKMIVYHQTKSPGEESWSAMEQELRYTELRRREFEIFNEIKAHSTMIESYLKAQKETAGFNEFTEVLFARKDDVLRDAEEMLKDEHIAPYTRDRIRALIRNIDGEDFSGQEREAQLRTLNRLYHELSMLKKSRARQVRKLVT